jgi:hypothetical protein
MIPHFNVKSFSFYSIDASRTEEKAQQKNWPNDISIWFSEPKFEVVWVIVSLIYSGTIALNIPVQIPWTILIIRNK